MIHLALAALLQQQAVPRAPQREVRDPGVIATGQRVSPAGVQSVFTGRVSGVRFGHTADEVWVAAPGTTYRLDWRANRALARVHLEGTPGVHAIAINPLTHDVVVSSVGRIAATSATPGTVAARQPVATHLSGVRADATGDSLAPRWNSTALGDFMAGAPAVAARAGADGRRVAVLPLPANDALAVLDAETGALVRIVPLGVEPIAATLSANGTTAFVSILGGPKPTVRNRSARQCCDPRTEAVRVDARGIAEAGSVARVDVPTGRVVADIAVAHHPTALAWDERGARLYVANGASDSVTVIDTRTNTASTHIAIAPFRERAGGLAPTALALSPNAATLYVALGGANAVAMYDVRNDAARLLGLIPTAWYPSSVDVSADGKYLAVGALLGVGSGEGATGGSPGVRGRYVHAVRGSVNVLPVPTPTDLAAFSAAVAQNNRLTLATSPAAQVVARDTVPRAVPRHPGDASLIDHVVFIVRENRTYDQILGDLGRGASDSALVIYGRNVTPNAHALSEQFVTLDHFFASGGNSADGHQWLTQANETDYPMWPLYVGRSYPSEGVDPLAYSTGGFLWESAQAKGKSVVTFGEFAPAPRMSSPLERTKMLEAYLR
ncbi:MAG: beta-propeller fold lactonase family protein, partial [bacterium]